MKLKEETKKTPKRVKKIKLIKNYIIAYNSKEGSKREAYFAKLPEARTFGRRMYRQDRFTSLKNKKGVVLPL